MLAYHEPAGVLWKLAYKHEPVKLLSVFIALALHGLLKPYEMLKSFFLSG